MLTLLKLLQSLVKTLHSEGTPAQVATGVALGAAWGLTPLLNFHNVAIAAVVMVLNVSVGGAMLGWLVFTPAGFLLDPLFDLVGRRLLLAPALEGLWTRLYNVPVLPWSNFNNTVVLGSVVLWLVGLVPIWFLARWGVRRYRETWGARLERTSLMRAIKASKVYNWYRLFQPE
jgi:uncharacterized protein (TIGR03546 family)